MADAETPPRLDPSPARSAQDATDPDLVPWYLREDGVTSRLDITMFGLLMGGVLLAIGLVAVYALVLRLGG